MADSSGALLQALRLRGAATSAQLQAALGISQATVSRALAPLLQTGQVLRVGRGRSQAYLLPRVVEGSGPNFTIPIIKVSEDGTASPFATLVPVAGGRFWVDEEAGPKALHDGLPWFLSDMRPQGFLGRTFANRHAGLGLAPNPDQWSDDDVLKALCLTGEDLPGNLVVGFQSFERLQQLPARQAVVTDYARLADEALHGGQPGSSAGGDQPKFCVVAAGRPVIVKFSPAGNAASAQRWRDLLVCEHLALDALAQAGIPAAASRIVEGGGRVFLEVVRFDRTERGRIGMVSLMAYDNEYVGKIDNWANTAERMATRSLLTDRDADRLRFLEAFGILIGNTDRHYGNISLLIEGDDWALAPAYDVLPMVYAPTAGELVERDFDPGSIGPPVQALRQWPDARVLAHRYWQVVAADGRISAAFGRRAAAHAMALRP
ncbi:MAG: type II toxin-antitoxin system HipA family toxin YjjJ [Ramlibacter sp.]